MHAIDNFKFREGLGVAKHETDYRIRGSVPPDDVGRLDSDSHLLALAADSQIEMCRH